MNRYVITSGNKYLDIDAYSSMIAYRELLNMQGKRAVAISHAPLNESVPSLIQKLNYHLDQDRINEEDRIIIVDVSNPAMFDSVIVKEQITEIIDHHTGFEAFWKEQHVISQIESIGSVCTILFEKFVEANLQNNLDQPLCKLLVAGILDNTLNLKADITTDRDRKAYQQLLQIGKIDADWYKTYFSACQNYIETHLESILETSLKSEWVCPLLPPTFGQLLILNSTFIQQYQQQITSFMNQKYEEWIFNFICLEEEKSYLFISKKGQEVAQLLKIKCVENTIIVSPFILRKELIKKAREFDQKKFKKEKE